MYKLLLVDDEQIIREGLERMIDWEGLGLRLTASCPNAIAALDSMTDDMPDILLTDVRMPGMDGLELAKRAAELHPQLRIIVLSGYDTFTYAQQAMRSGVMEYLLKPCAKEDLAQALLRARVAVDKERKRVMHLSGERRMRVRTLVEKLDELRESIMEPAHMERKVCELAKTVEDASLLREALVLLVTSSPGGWTGGVENEGCDGRVSGGRAAGAPDRSQPHSFAGRERRGHSRFCAADDGLCAGELRNRSAIAAIFGGKRGVHERRLHRQGVWPHDGT